ncbi:MAG: hypothetical protein RL021_895 [Bacteroidota bacterium]|jgi:hypothetical protein
MVFYLSIVLYIASVIAALILMITGKSWTLKRFFLLASIHICFILLYLLKGLRVEENASTNYFFLFFVCTGTALSGLIWRITSPLLLRAYFSLFMLTFPLFLFSPSMLVNFLLTGKYTDTLGKTFCIKDNLFLEQQQGWKGTNGTFAYKLVERHGIFHKPIARDIQFGGRIDSTRTLLLLKDSTTSIRGYRITETYVSTTIDSIDVTVDLRPKTEMKIERKLLP